MTRIWYEHDHSNPSGCDGVLPNYLIELSPTGRSRGRATPQRKAARKRQQAARRVNRRRK